MAELQELERRWDLQQWEDPEQGDLCFRLRLQGQTFTRRVHFNDMDALNDLQIASMYWRNSERAATSGLPHEQRSRAVLTEQCLALERIFPEATDLLPV